MNNNKAPITEWTDLASLYRMPNQGVILVKPKAILKRIEDVFGRPMTLNLQFPSSNIGSLTMLEATMIAAIIRLSDPKELFEFGTFLGYSTALLINNSIEEARVHSLDLESANDNWQYAKEFSEQELRANHISNDNYLRMVQAEKGPYYLSTISDQQRSRLNLLKGDSLEFDCRLHKLCGVVDFVFVDGGHEYDIIKSDTMKSFQLIGDSGIVVWHDFNSKIHFEVTKFLNEMSVNQNIIYIENTMLAFSVVGKLNNTFF